MRLLYEIFLRAYQLFVRAASPFNPKAKKWIEGRQGVFEKLTTFAKNNPQNIWVHCASVGEFEQGLPLIAKLQNSFPNYTILVSFFSPSGYEYVREKYPDLAIIYLPLDTKKNAKKWVKTLSPTAAFFVKYEFWHHYFNTLKTANIPLLMVSAVFWKELFFFKWYGRFFRKALNKVSHFFVQDEASKRLLNGIGLDNVSIAGDARFERVLELKNTFFSDAKIENFKRQTKIFMAGSAWNHDIPVLKEIIANLPKGYKIIIAPHEIVHFPYQDFEKYKTTFYSKENEMDANILFLDTMGILSKAYRYADVVYIGGGFGKGIHNVLEAAVYNKPIFIGPNHQRFVESLSLLAIGSLKVFTSIKDVENQLNFSLDLTPEVTIKNEKFITENTNVTEQIVVFIKKHHILY